MSVQVTHDYGHLPKAVQTVLIKGSPLVVDE